MSTKTEIYFTIIIILFSTISCSHFNFLSLFPNYPLELFQNELSSGNSDLLDLLAAIQIFIYKYSSKNYVITEEGKKCFGENLSKINAPILIEFFSFSGKGKSEPGLETECYLSKKGNFSYYLLDYKYNASSFSSFKDDNEVYQLINQTNFYTGICFFESCVDFMNVMFNKETNPKLFNFLRENDSLVNLTVLMGKNELSFQQEVEYGNKFDFIMFISCLLLVSILFSIQLIIALCKLCCHKGKSKSSSQQIEQQYLLDSDEGKLSGRLTFKNASTSL